MPRQAAQFANDLGPDVPAQIPPRLRLEWEVAQLADGTLASTRREAVEAALLSDAQLREMFQAHRQVHALLRQPAALQGLDFEAFSAGVMSTVRREPVPGQIEHESPAPMRLAGQESLGVVAALRGWWMTISAVAAALVLGLTIGVLSTGRGAGEMVVSVGRPGGEVVAQGELDVSGPSAIVGQRLEASPTGPGSGGVAMTVSGPDYRAVIDPQGPGTMPDYAVLYVGPGFFEPPSRMVVASSLGEAAE